MSTCGIYSHIVPFLLVRLRNPLDKRSSLFLLSLSLDPFSFSFCFESFKDHRNLNVTKIQNHQCNKLLLIGKKVTSIVNSDKTEQKLSNSNFVKYPPKILSMTYLKPPLSSPNVVSLTWGSPGIPMLPKHRNTAHNAA